MMKVLIALCLGCAFVFPSCDLSAPADEAESLYLSHGIEPSYMVSGGHFVDNWYTAETIPSCLLIRDFDCFDEYFSIGWVQGMDESRLITEERMEGGFVLSVIYQGNDVSSLGVERIVLQNGRLIVRYARKVIMEDASFTGNYHATVLIEDCDFDSVMLVENGRWLDQVPVTEVVCD